MPRPPKPFIYREFYCTNYGGIPHQKLCRVEEGKKAAELQLARLMTRRADAPETFSRGPSNPLKKLVHEVVDEWLTMQKVETAERTYKFYCEKLRPFRERFGTKPIRSLTLQDGLLYKNFLMKEKTWVKGKQLKHGLGNGTVNHCIRVSRMLLRWAAKASRGYIVHNPWEEIGYLDENERERTITDEELQHLLDHCANGNHAGGARDFQEEILLMRNTTMRPGELRCLRWDYIDLQRHIVKIPFDKVKTRGRRQFTLNDVAEAVIEARRTRLEKLSGKKVVGFVFPGGDRSDPEVEMNDQTLSQRFRRLFKRCVKLGLIQEQKSGENLVLYSTRHSKVTDLVRAKLPQKVVMSEAGHLVPSTTHRYTHLVDDEQTALVRQDVPAVGALPADEPEHMQGRRTKNRTIADGV